MKIYLMVLSVAVVSLGTLIWSNRAEKQRVIQEHTRAIEEAIDNALHAHTYDDAYIILKNALQNYTQATNLNYARIMLTQYRAEKKAMDEGMVLIGTQYFPEEDLQDVIMEAAFSEKYAQ